MQWDFLEYCKRLEETVAHLKRAWGEAPEWAIVFGSGLGQAFLSEHVCGLNCSFSEVPYFHRPIVDGHPGVLSIYGADEVFPKKGIVLQGRNHYYQGMSSAEVVFPVRALALWGVRRFILTNASGSIDPHFVPGTLAMIEDHLNLTGDNPLRGPNLDFLGPRFPAMSRLYQNSLTERCDQAAQKLNISLHKGVYVGVCGPSYETCAEVAAYRKLGGHMVGMSTVHEAIALGHAGAEVLGLSAITNEAGSKETPDHESVLLMARKVDLILARLLQTILQSL